MVLAELQMCVLVGVGAFPDAKRFIFVSGDTFPVRGTRYLRDYYLAEKPKERGSGTLLCCEIFPMKITAT